MWDVECCNCKNEFTVDSFSPGLWTCPHCNKDNYVDYDTKHNGYVSWTRKPVDSDYDDGSPELGEVIEG